MREAFEQTDQVQISTVDSVQIKLFNIRPVDKQIERYPPR